MLTQRGLSVIACRAASLSLLIAATSLVADAQAASPTGQRQSPVLVASVRTPLDLAALAAGSSSSVHPNSAAPNLFDLKAASLAAFQPPPRRYGRPNYSDKNSNPDGSPKYTFLAGVGVAIPIGDTHFYETPGYNFQVGGGRNFNQYFGVILQFDYDHFGLQGKTLANQEFVYNYCTPAQVLLGCTASVTGLDGNNHVWSFTLNPTFTFPTTGPLGAYAVLGGGFYHKVTNFTLPQTTQQCGLYGCGFFTVQANVDHYTSNAGGINGGLGLTVKLSQFSNQRLFMEGRYVFVANQMRTGVTAANVATAPANATDFYPANAHRTTYIPITLGIRF